MQTGWFKAVDLSGNKFEILLRYDTGNGDTEKRKVNFIRAAAIAEIETGCMVLLNDEGRRLVEEAKRAEDRIKQAQIRLFEPIPLKSKPRRSK